MGTVTLDCLLGGGPAVFNDSGIIRRSTTPHGDIGKSIID